MGQIANTNSDWTKYNLGDLGRYLNGRAFGKDEWKENGLPIIRIQNLNDHGAKFNYAEGTYEDRYKVKNGDLLVSWAASLGVYLWDRGDAWLNQHIFKVEPDEKLVTKDFLYFLLKATLNQLLAKTHGTGMVHITKGDFDNQEVFIPSIPEQELIVSKLKTVLPMVLDSTAKIKQAKLGVSKFRQSILSDAVTGKLTEDWRERNNISFEDWQQTELSTVIDNFQNGLAKRDSKVGEDIAVIRLADIVSLRISKNSFRKIKLSPQEINKYKLEENDILIIRVNGSAQIVGNFVLVTDKNNWAYCDHFIRIKCNKLLFPPYLVYLTRTLDVRNYINQNMVSSAGQNTVNQEMIKKIIFTLPSIEEQKEIVRKVNYYFEIADKVEGQIAEAEAKVSKLTQAVLGKVFRQN